MPPFELTTDKGRKVRAGETAGHALTLGPPPNGRAGPATPGSALNAPGGSAEGNAASPCSHGQEGHVGGGACRAETQAKPPEPSLNAAEISRRLTPFAPQPLHKILRSA